MKRFLLAVVMALVLALASPAAADVPFRLVVDDVPIAQPIILVNDTSYVPIRAVADIFKATTDWNFQTKTISIKTKPVDIKEIKRPPIKGDAEFTEKINAALDLLEEKDFPHYVMVCQNTWDIAPLLIDNPAESVKDSLAFSIAGSTRIMPLLINDSRRYTPTYLAGILVHEACHAVNNNYDRDLPQSEAFAHELTAYKLIGAPKWMIDEIEWWVKEYRN
jgi:hypothetical protein